LAVHRLIDPGDPSSFLCFSAPQCFGARFAGENRIVQHVDQKDLAERWLISPRTLEQWRWQGRGPRYLKIGGRVVYRLCDIEAFESARLHANTTGPIRKGTEEKPADGTR
jgi:hypothetical protein